jgi:hypothetical protein
MKDGRNATQPYRVRVGTIWYWVDPTARDLAPGDTVVVYPVAGNATLAILQSPFKPNGDETSAHRAADFSSLEGERFTVPARDISALHLAAVDDDQT